MTILIKVQKVYLPSSLKKCNENCGLPAFFTDYQIRHIGNLSGSPEILVKIDPDEQLKTFFLTHTPSGVGNFRGENFKSRGNFMN